ncbi:MAG TPA: GAF domain-containing SpoIIE family protein phosphatase [Thermoanaerobaculia bacterium]|nr:GAF domain-containing SpoIIE family protein phosphatase [Thermoanaerobaculia bacterium]
MSQDRAAQSAVMISNDPLSAGSSANISLPVVELERPQRHTDRTAERLTLLNRLMMELLEEKPMTELFDFIVEKVMQLLSPSRVALGILAPDRQTFTDFSIRRDRADDTAELLISRTLLNEVVENRRAVSFSDESKVGDLALAKSIAAQDIRSALCAPIIVRGDVMGVLYIDYLLLTHVISEDDVKLAAQISRIAARKLETTLLREEVESKRKMDEELKTAFLIQSRLLPAGSPKAEGFRFAGHNRPCRTVSGDYYDFVTRPDGRVYLIIADVSGKGITAALVMAGVAAAFNTLTSYDHSPGRILKDLNRLLYEKTDPSMFVTAFCAVVDPKSGKILYSNAGHNPPLIVAPEGVEQLATRSGIALGCVPEFGYVEEEIELPDAATLYLYTDGITEASNASDELFEMDRLRAVLEASKGEDARGIALATLSAADEFVQDAPQADDITIVCVQRVREEQPVTRGETFHGNMAS